MKKKLAEKTVSPEYQTDWLLENGKEVIDLTPMEIWEQLKKQNESFAAYPRINRNFAEDIRSTKNGQSPLVAFVSCIDSRVPAEIVFKLGIGYAFNSRIAGNFVNQDVLGGLEFAYQTSIKLIVVLGHTSCGAIEAAVENCDCPDASAGKSDPEDNILPMIDNLCVSVCRTPEEQDDEKYLRKVTETNIEVTIENIRKNSSLLRGAEMDKKIAIVGAIYDVGTGKVTQVI